MRKLFLLPLLLALAACGGDDPAAPEPADQAFPLELVFINDAADPVIIAEIRGRIQVPGEASPREVLRNWQRPVRGDSLVLEAELPVPVGSVIETWYLVCADWTIDQTVPSWRVWASLPDTVRGAADVRQEFLWPFDRFILTEVPFPPPSSR